MPINFVPEPRIPRYWFYQDSTNIVFPVEEMTSDTQGYVYLGVTNNPDAKMAVAVLLQHHKVKSGWKIRDRPE